MLWGICMCVWCIQYVCLRTCNCASASVYMCVHIRCVCVWFVQNVCTCDLHMCGVFAYLRLCQYMPLSLGGTCIPVVICMYCTCVNAQRSVCVCVHLPRCVHVCVHISSYVCMHNKVGPLP